MSSMSLGTNSVRYMSLSLGLTFFFLRFLSLHGRRITDPASLGSPAPHLRGVAAAHYLSMSLPHFLQTRTRLPPSRRRLMRVGCEQLGQSNMTLDTCIVPSISMIPPCVFFWVGRVCRLIIAA